MYYWTFFLIWISFTIYGFRKKWSKIVSICGGFLIACFALSIISLLWFPSEQDSNNVNQVKKSKKRAIVYNSDWDSSVRQVEQYLQNNLKDPDSFEAIEWSEVVEGAGEKAAYLVRLKYRAKNSFGGYAVANQLFYLDKNGTIRSVIDWKE